MKKNLILSFLLLAISLIISAKEPEWKPLFNGKNLDGLTVRGKATWKVENGVLIGEGGMGHIYLGPQLTDLEAKGTFRISSTSAGAKSNSGFYFRANEPADNPDGFPQGYEAQICHNQDAYTGWLWMPGKPTGKATKLLTKDGEWFDYLIKAVGPKIQFWINGELVMTYLESTFTKGRFAIQGHNPGMKIEAKNLYYRDLSK
jgi:hypothetical protein